MIILESEVNMSNREHWGSKLGVILAVAGSAVGLGNFLRFPVKAAQFGGGAFLIPYFIALVLLAIPLAWMEWTLGRYASIHGHGTGPGLIDKIFKKPWAKYAGSFGLFAPTYIGFYYVFIQSWLLAFAWYSLTGELMGAVHAGTIKTFFGDFILLKSQTLGIPSAIFFFVLTFLANFLVLASGVRKGIERLNKIAMPILLLMGIGLAIRVLTIPGIEKGLAYMWNPDFSSLLNPRVWIEASGQVFFTLSIGIAVILCYASYVKRNEDLVLSAYTAGATNTFAEVILGGTIVIPLAIVLYGADISEVAKMGTFGLGFQTMPVVFGKLPLSSFLQFTWFVMLFFAGMTSAISIQQPLVSFCEDELQMKRRSAISSVALFQLVGSLLAIFGLAAGAVDEMDFWGGSMLLIIGGTLQAFLFSFVLRDEGWKLMMEGSHLHIPNWVKFVMKWVTPFYLVAMLLAWLVTDGWGVIILKNVDPKAMVTFLGSEWTQTSFIWFTRGFLVLSALFINGVVWYAWKSGKALRGRQPYEGQEVLS